MSGKKKLTLSVVLISIVLAALDWIQWDIALFLNASYPAVIPGLAHNLLFAVKLVVAAVLVGIGVYCAAARKQILTLVIALAAVVAVFVLPFSDLNVKLNEVLFGRQRKEVAELFSDGELDSYRIGENKYSLPLKYRMSSHCAYIYANEKPEGAEILFYVHKGFRDTVIIYEADGKPDAGSFFGMKFANVRQLDENTFSAQENMQERFAS